MGPKSILRLMRTLGPSPASLVNLLGVFYPMPLEGRIASHRLKNLP